MAHRVYINSTNKDKNFELLVEWNYEVPVYWLAAFAGSHRLKGSKLLVDAPEAAAHLLRFIEFIQRHKHVLIERIEEFDANVELLIQCCKKLADCVDVFLNADDVFNISSDTAAERKVQMHRWSEDLTAVNGTLSACIDSNDVEAFSKLMIDVEVSSVQGSLREAINEPVYEYGLNTLFDRPSQNSVEAFQENGLWGIRRTGGEIVLEPCFEEMYASWGDYRGQALALVRLNGLYGYVNAQGDVVVSCEYEDAYEFQSLYEQRREASEATFGFYISTQVNAAVVQKDGMQGVLHYSEISKIKEEHLIASIGTVAVLVDCEYKCINIQSQHSSGAGFFSVQKQERYGIINHEGKLGYPFELIEQPIFGESYDVYAAQVKDEQASFYLDGQFRAFGKDFEIVDTIFWMGQQTRCDAGYSYNYYAHVQVQNAAGLYGIYDTHHHCFALPMIYEKIQSYQFTGWWRDIDSESYTHSAFGDEVVFVVNQQKKTGLVCLNSQQPLEPIVVLLGSDYDSIKPVSSEVSSHFITSRQKRFGLFDAQNKTWLLPETQLHLSSFSFDYEFNVYVLCVDEEQVQIWNAQTQKFQPPTLTQLEKCLQKRLSVGVKNRLLQVQKQLCDAKISASNFSEQEAQIAHQLLTEYDLDNPNDLLTALWATVEHAQDEGLYDDTQAIQPVDMQARLIFRLYEQSDLTQLRYDAISVKIPMATHLLAMEYYQEAADVLKKEGYDHRSILNSSLESDRLLAQIYLRSGDNNAFMQHALNNLDVAEKLAKSRSFTKEYRAANLDYVEYVGYNFAESLYEAKEYKDALHWVRRSIQNVEDEWIYPNKIHLEACCLFNLFPLQPEKWLDAVSTALEVLRSRENFEDEVKELESFLLKSQKPEKISLLDRFKKKFE